MREWDLVANDPLELTLAADFRLCTTDYLNDHIWELEIGGGDPNALSVSTTYGLRAKVMRIFPGFIPGRKSRQKSRGDALTDPALFHRSVHIHRFYPNYLKLDFSPFPGINVMAEYWVPDSHSLAGRYRVTNDGDGIQSFALNLYGQLSPIEGQSFSPLPIQSVNVLAGHTSDLFPVIFITGGPQIGQGPFASLSLDLELAPGKNRVFTWVQAALDNQQESFEMARRIAARPWEAERARIEMVNTSQTIDVRTGDLDWDAAFALSQKTAFHLFLSPTGNLQFPSFVTTRQPDNGFSMRGDGKDYNRLWNGQTPLESYFLSSVIPGAAQLLEGLVRNFLATQSEDGSIDWKPGLAGQRGRWMAAPILSTLAWKIFQKTKDAHFLEYLLPQLDYFVRCWFNEKHDIDQDGFPEWNNTLHFGMDDHPAFSIWQENSQGADISAIENPGLAALLSHEMQSLANIADAVDQKEQAEKYGFRSGELGALVEECWNAEASLYHNRDRDSHDSSVGKFLGEFTGSGKFPIKKSFKIPIRLIIQITLKEDITRRIDVQIRGSNQGGQLSERLERMSFQWGEGRASATSQHVFNRVDEIEIVGLEKTDQVIVNTLDLSGEDITLFLPLWAEIPSSRRAQSILDRVLFAPERFWHPFGIPSWTVVGQNSHSEKTKKTKGGSPVTVVHIPWNTLIGEALMGYDLRVQSAELMTHIMPAIINSLKKQHAFARGYDSKTGKAVGERNALQGLAPIELFLVTLGVQIESDKRVILTGMNPFPWPVTVKYRGLSVTRDSKQTIVTFPNGQILTFIDPTDSIVSIE